MTLNAGKVCLHQQVTYSDHQVRRQARHSGKRLAPVLDIDSYGRSYESSFLESLADMFVSQVLRVSLL